MQSHHAPLHTSVDPAVYGTAPSPIQIDLIDWWDEILARASDIVDYHRRRGTWRESRKPGAVVTLAATETAYRLFLGMENALPPLGVDDGNDANGRNVKGVDGRGHRLLVPTDTKWPTWGFVLVYLAATDHYALLLGEAPNEQVRMAPIDATGYKPVYSLQQSQLRPVSKPTP